MILHFPSTLVPQYEVIYSQILVHGIYAIKKLIAKTKDSSSVNKCVYMFVLEV